MKTNDTVRVLDGSFSVEVTSKGLEHSLLGLMHKSRFKVIKTNQNLPAQDHGLKLSPPEINDTIIQSMDGRIFYVQQRLLEVTKIARFNGWRQFFKILSGNPY